MAKAIYGRFSIKPHSLGYFRCLSSDRVGHWVNFNNGMTEEEAIKLQIDSATVEYAQNVRKDIGENAGLSAWSKVLYPNVFGTKSWRKIKQRYYEDDEEYEEEQ